MKAHWDRAVCCVWKHDILMLNAKSPVLTSCCSTTFDGLFDLLLILPAKVGVPSDISSGLSCSSLPEAREVVPVGDLPIKHG